MTDQPRPKNHKRSRLLIAGIAALIFVLLFVVAFFVARSWGEGKVRGEVQRLADGAGLKLTLDDVSLSPMGDLVLSGLRLSRQEGGDVVALESAAAHLSPLRALKGSRRPERIALRGMKLDVRVVDGQPSELLALYMSARRMIPARRGSKSKTSSIKRLTPIVEISDGEVRLSLRGHGAEYLPKGLHIGGVQVNLDPDRGLGELTAQVDGSVRSKLSATVEPAQGDKPARVHARFAPEFRLELPPKTRAGQLFEALVISGVGFDRVQGLSLEGVELRRGAQAALRVERVHLKREEQTGLRAEKISLRWPMTGGGSFLRSKRSTKKGKSGKSGAVAGSRSKRRPQKNKTPHTNSPQAAELSATIASVEIMERAGHPGLHLRLDRAQLPLPDDRGELRLRGLEISTSSLSLRDPLAALVEVVLTEPELKLKWREGLFKGVPGGAKIEQLVAWARWGEVAAKSLGKESNGKGKAKVKGARRGRKLRRPASRGLVSPLRKLYRRGRSLPKSTSRLVAQFAKLSELNLKIVAGRLGLYGPAAEEPFAGLREVNLSLTPQLGDGGRGLEARMTPFGDGKALGEVKLDVIAASPDRLASATFALSGGGLARGFSAMWPVISAREQAKLAVKLKLTPGVNEEGSSLNLDFETQKLGLNWWRLAPVPVDDFDLEGQLKVSLDLKRQALVLELPKLKVNQALLKARVDAHHLLSAKPRIAFHMELPRQDCGAVAVSLPPSLTSAIGRVEAEGEIGWTFDFDVRPFKPYKSKLDATLDDADCVVKRFGEIDLNVLAGKFKRPVNESGTVLDDQLIGPQSEAWVNLIDLPPWVPYAMMVTEDAAFYHHRGLRLGLLSRALKMLMDWGRFVYGGSTITQQLVKNLFLTRDKFLARKFEELLIVWHMERDLMAKKKLSEERTLREANKDRIMELYVNAIEFGPHIYGVYRAAETYFGKEPSELTPLESAFLAANKPCPKCGYKIFMRRKWTPWWQERMVGIMKKMRKDAIISEEQFVAEAPYVPRFVGWPQTKSVRGEAQIGGAEE